MLHALWPLRRFGTARLLAVMNDFSLPSRLREGQGVGMDRPDWQPRNTARARSLRRQATPAERALWEHLSRSRLGAKFSRQMPVGPYFADFLCRELKLVVELDGHSHDVAPRRDAARDRWMHAQGYRVLRFRNADVFENVEGVVWAITEEIGKLRSLPLTERTRDLGPQGGS